MQPRIVFSLLALLLVVLAVYFERHRSYQVEVRNEAPQTVPLGAANERVTMPPQPLKPAPLAPSAVKSISAASPAMAEAILAPMNEDAASGTVRFVISDGALVVSAKIQRTGPGQHGLAIHAGHRCLTFDGKPAFGPHLDPFQKDHGTPNTNDAHLGDLGNVDVGVDGTGVLELYLEDSYFPVDERGGWPLILGNIVVLHQNPDDYVTQPDGNAGPGIACGVITSLADGDNPKR